jgi:hypothetical protein
MPQRSSTDPRRDKGGGPSRKRIAHIRGTVCGGSLQAAGRAPLHPNVERLLARCGLPRPPEGSVLTLAAVDAALKGEKTSERLLVKDALFQHGLMER